MSKSKVFKSQEAVVTSWKLKTPVNIWRLKHSWQCKTSGVSRGALKTPSRISWVLLKNQVYRRELSQQLWLRKERQWVLSVPRLICRYVMWPSNQWHSQPAPGSTARLRIKHGVCQTSHRPWPLDSPGKSTSPHSVVGNSEQKIRATFSYASHASSHILLWKKVSQVISICRMLWQHHSSRPNWMIHKTEPSSKMNNNIHYSNC